MIEPYHIPEERQFLMHHRINQLNVDWIGWQPN